MRHQNYVRIVGNTGNDPEMKYTQTGTAICNLSVASTERWQQNGEWKERTEWHRCSAFGKTAEHMQTVKKGDMVAIEGRIQTRSWDDQSGQKRYVTEIVVNDFGIIEKRDTATNNASAAPPVSDEDLPF